MLQPSTIKKAIVCLCLWGTTALAQPVSVHGCKLQWMPCGNGPILCYIFANQQTDMPDPRPLNDSSLDQTQHPISANEWANRCYRLYVGLMLNADADRAVNDPMAQMYSALQAATSSDTPSVFSAIFYNPTGQTRQGKLIYVGATEPLPDENQSDDELPNAQFVQDNWEAIFKSLATGGQEQLIVDVPGNGGMAMKVFTPRNIPNPELGFYAAGVFSQDQQQKVLFERGLVLSLGVFRRVDN
jgi:hypothetical protein